MGQFESPLILQHLRDAPLYHAVKWESAHVPPNELDLQARCMFQRCRTTTCWAGSTLEEAILSFRLCDLPDLIAGDEPEEARPLANLHPSLRDIGVLPGGKEQKLFDQNPKQLRAFHLGLSFVPSAGEVPAATATSTGQAFCGCGSNTQHGSRLHGGQELKPAVAWFSFLTHSLMAAIGFEDFRQLFAPFTRCAGIGLPWRQGSHLEIYPIWVDLGY